MTGCQRRYVSLSSSKLPLCHCNGLDLTFPPTGLRDRFAGFTSTSTALGLEIGKRQLPPIAKCA